MLPQIFHWRLPFHASFLPGTITLYGYGLMMVFAFLGCQWLAARLARSKGLDPDIFVNATLIALAAGIVGSRLSHVLENLPDYTRPDRTVAQNLWAMINITSGGLTFYGGLILAAPIVLAYFIYRKVPARLAMDIGAPCIVLGLGIGRLGCYLNGCCYGADTTLPWAARFPYYSNAYVQQFQDGTLDHSVPPQLLVRTDAGTLRLRTPDEVAARPELKSVAAAERANPVHPAQLYSTITSFLIVAVTLAYFTLPHAGGRCLALMLMMEGPSRFLLEMLRVEKPILGPMSLSMVIGVVLFVVGVVLWFVLSQRPPHGNGTRRGFEAVARTPQLA